jgi:hypothetical protein
LSQSDSIIARVEDRVEPFTESHAKDDIHRDTGLIINPLLYFGVEFVNTQINLIFIRVEDLSIRIEREVNLVLKKKR